MIPDTDPRDAVIDAATPTEAEAAQAALPLDGSDLTPEGIAAAAAAKTAAADAEAAAAAKAAEEAAAAEAAAKAAAEAAKPIVQAYVPPATEEPQPPKDFDAEFAALQKKYDDGDLDAVELQKASRELSKEEAAFTAKHIVWEENMTARNAALETHKAEVETDWNTAAIAFQTQHAEFMSNEAQKTALQDAVAVIDQLTGGKLAASELLARAAAQVFPQFNYAPGAAPAKTEAELKAEALKARQPAEAPKTLADAPSAAAIQIRGNETFAELDALPIDKLEEALAKMPNAQREAYLASSPGSNFTGRGE
jgi:hypothetical protein